MKFVITAIMGMLLFALTSVAASPTFNKDIAPILYKNCAMCHRAGEVAPFALLTYQDAAKRAKLIATVTEKRYMPPWKAEHGYGSFANERRLTDAQIELIKAWAEAGAPEGDAADKPVPPVFAEGWLGGEPDKVVNMPVKYSLAADGPDQFQCFVLPLNLEDDAYVSLMEFRPGNRRIVHHALVFLDPSNAGRKLASADGTYPCFGGPRIPGTTLVGGWAPGAVPGAKSQEYARPVPKGSDLVLQIHYHPSGKPEEDQSSLGLSFSGPPSKGRTAVIMFNTRINIPPGDPHYVVKTSLVLPRDIELAGITPHAHYLCKDMKITAHLPDGSVQPLIWIKDWDFNWQGGYTYVKPLSLPKGTRVAMEYTYDNSENNPRNPAHPPVRVTWGEQTKDEMAVAFLTVALPSPSDARAFQQELSATYLESIFSEDVTLDDLPREMTPQQRQSVTMVFNLFDKNKDGKLDAEERTALLQFLRNRR
jgi:mono/diheme cytochrome c family protein